MGLLVGLAVGFQFYNDNIYRQDWISQRDMFWQLSWRVPGLNPGTSILAVNTPTLIHTDYALALPVNFIYSYKHNSPQLDYWMFYLPTDVGTVIPQLSGNVTLQGTTRAVSFNGSTDHSIVVWFSSSGCLRLVDSNHDRFLPIPALAQASLALSHTAQVITDPSAPARPPKNIFGSEPQHGWCYYFQQADLSRQKGDWQHISQIYSQATGHQLSPDDPTEWMPFIEGLLSGNNITAASDLIRKVLNSPTPSRSALCDLVSRVETRDSQTIGAIQQSGLGAMLACQTLGSP
jgi:hypothetical protein